jgi:uncharacterized protein YeaO (DUF488 family)
MIKIKRVYEKVERDDGYRVLIDRLWPRGLSKEKLKMDEWLKDIAVSDELRKRFCHDPSRWEEFRKKYLAELKAKEEVLNRLVAKAGEGNLTILYGAKDEVHNNAVVLKELLNEKMKRH